MKLIVDMSPETFIAVKNLVAVNLGRSSCKTIIEDVFNSLKTATPIPDNTTRAEIFEIIFGVKIYPEDSDDNLFCIPLKDGGCEECPLKQIQDEQKAENCVTASAVWWYAPYRKE